MVSQAWSLLALVLVFSSVSGSFAARHLLDPTEAAPAPEAAPTAIPKLTIPAIPTSLPPIPSITIPMVSIPTTLPSIPSIPTTVSTTIPATIPTALSPMPAIPSIVPFIPTSIPKIPGLQIPSIPFMSQPPATTSP